MKKLILSVLFTLLFSTTVLAGEIKVNLNGEYITFDQPPIIEDSRTMVPFRAIFEHLGAEVEWDDATRTAIGYTDDIRIELPIDKKTARVNGKNVELDVPAMIVNGRTLVPLRFVSETMGLKVEWDNDTRTVLMETLNEEAVHDYANITRELKSIDGEHSFYYINRASDNDFYNNVSDAYKIMHVKNGESNAITNERAYDFTILDDQIYFIKLDGLEREEGFVQSGYLWSVGLDGTNERLVLENKNEKGELISNGTIYNSIYSIASDDKYLYFTGSSFGSNIMRMEFGKEPHVFIEDVKSFRLKYLNGWLYYSDDSANSGIRRINVETKEVETLTEKATDYYSGFMFVVYENYIIMNSVVSDTWENETICINLKTGTETKIKPGLYFDVTDTGILINSTYEGSWEDDTFRRFNQFVEIDWPN